MIHALYGHRLDCGPLVLSDIHYLLATRPIAADTLGALAEKGGWLRGAELLLALTSRYFGSQPLSLRSAPPEDVLAAAEEALLQDLSTRSHAILMSDLMAARSAAAWAGSLARRLRPRAHVLAAEGGGTTGWRSWPIWATRRLGAVARGIATRRTSREASQSAALLRWLQG